MLRVQLAPPLALRWTPSLEPVSTAAYTFCALRGSIAMPVTAACRGSPNVFFHVAPPSVVFHTPSLHVPAYSVRGFVGSSASECTDQPRSVADATVHVAPASVLLSTPPPCRPA